MATIISERLFSKFEDEFRPHLEAVGLDEAIFRRADLEVPIDKYTALLERVAAKDNPAIGLQMGQGIEASDLGVLGYAVLAAADVRQFLETLSTYLYVFAQDNVIRLDVSRDTAVVSYRYTAPGVSEFQRDVEFATSAIVRTVSAAVGRPTPPRYAEFEHRRPEYSEEYKSAFGCPVRFGCGGNRLHYDRAVLDRRLISGDPRHFEALTFYLADRLKFRAQDADFMRRLRHLITASLHTGVPELSSIAEQMGMSARTLQRRMSEHEIVFSDLVDNIRKGIAFEYVRETDYRLIDIAQILGYQEPSSFTRAFKRWTDKTPRQVRQAAQQEESGNSTQA